MAGSIQFEKLISIFEADLTPLERAVASGIRLVDRFENKIRNTKVKFGGATGTGFDRQVDREMRAAQADIRRFERERTRMEREHTRQVEREARQREAARTREYKRSMNQMLADSRQRQRAEQKAQAGSFFGAGRIGLGGAMALGAGAGAALGLTTGLAAIASEGREAYVQLDKLVRFTATLDQSFQTPAGLKALTRDIEALTLKIPQSAESIAEASFTVKSAYQKMSEPELIRFLEKLGVQATASNTTISEHAKRVVALASQYKFSADQLEEFGAIMTTTFGAALSEDAEVAKGFQSLITPAITAGQSLNELAAAMGTVQSASSDADAATTGLKQVFLKFIDPNFANKMQATFGVAMFDSTGKVKGLNDIVHEVAKSLEGLTDKEKNAKIGAVFTDQREAIGFLTLIRQIQLYDDLLKQGGDAEAFKQKTDTMLNSAEARWLLFSNKVAQIKRDIGDEVTNIPTAGAESETGLGSVGLTLNALNNSISKGVYEITQSLAISGVDIGGVIEDALGFGDPVRIEAARESVRQFYAGLNTELHEQTETLKLSVLGQQKLDFSKILDDPRSTATMKEAARAKVASLNQTLAREFAQGDPIIVNKLRIQIGDQAFGDITKDFRQKMVEGLNKAALDATNDLNSVDPVVRKKAQSTIEAYKETATAVLKNTDLSPEFRAQIEKSLANFPDYIPVGPITEAGTVTSDTYATAVQAGMLLKAPDIGAAAQTAITTGTGQVDVSTPSSSLGYNFAMGVASGIRSGYGPIGAAIAGAITWAVSSGEKKAEQQSPSRLAARELGIPFVQGIAVGLNSPKAKAAIKQSIKQVYDDLVYEAGRIDPEAGKAKAAVERFYSSLLMDQSASFDEQIDRVLDYYNEIYRVEADSYRRRLDNITRQEDAIRQRKDLKADEKRRMLRDLADKRGDEEAGWADTTFNLNKNKNLRISDISQAEIARGMAEFKRQMSRDSFGDIGINRTATEQAKRDSEDRLRLIDEEIRRQEALRDGTGRWTEQYATAQNRITDLEEQRKDAVVEGEKEIAAARKADEQSLKELQASIADFANRSKEIEFDAAQAKIEVMRATGASEAEIFAAEQALSIERENFRHAEFMRELMRERDRLLAADTSGKERLRIETTYNQLLEAEANRHQGALGVIAANEKQNSILEQWKQVGAQLPTYQAQLKQFAIDAPATIAGVFSQAISQMDGTWKGFLKSLKQAFFQTVQQMLAELFRVQLTKALTGLFTSLFGGIFSGGGSVADLAAPAASHFAEGGVPPMNRISLVGEHGPELFVPARAGRILSNEESKAAIAGAGKGGSTVINNTVVQNFKTPRSLTAPRSVRQQAEAATVGLMAATQRR